MKNTKLSKILLIALSVAVLIGCAFVLGTSAEETPAENEILAQNIVYGDKVAIAYAVNASIEDAAAGNVTVNYYWEGAPETVKKATYITDDVYTKDGVEYPIFITEGVAPKELAKVAYATTDGETYKTYSAAEYLYVRLYEDNFVNKTEADGKDYNRKLLYQNLLAYGEQAQIVLNFNANKLVTDYNFVYTTHEDVTIGGGKSAFNVETVEPTYIGSASCVGWIATDLEGNETEYPKAAFAVDGVISITPKIEVHVHADENKDHKCDKCKEVMSVCADSDKNGLCDVCKVMTFNFDITTGVHLATGSAVIQNSFTLGTEYTPASNAGVKGNIVEITKKFEGGRQEVSNVLKIVVNNGKSNNTSLATLGGKVYFTPIKQSDDGGNIHVLEYDYNYAQTSKVGYRNPIDIYAWDAEGNSLGSIEQGTGEDKYKVFITNNKTFTEGTSAENAYQIGVCGPNGQLGAAQSETVGGKFNLLNSDTWYRIRFVWDQSTGKVNIAASNDGGETWYRICSEQSRAVLANADYLTFSFDQVWGAGSIQYFDNISYSVVSTMPEMPETNGIK